MSEENKEPENNEDPLAQGEGAPAPTDDEGPKPLGDDEGPKPVGDTSDDPLAQTKNDKREKRFQDLHNQNKQFKQEQEVLKKRIAELEKAKAADEPRNRGGSKDPDNTGGDDPKAGTEEGSEGPILHPTVEKGLEAAITSGKYDEDSLQSISAKVKTEIPELADVAFVSAMVKHGRSEKWVDAIQDNPTFMRNLNQVADNHPGDDKASQRQRMRDYEYIISHVGHYNNGEALIKTEGPAQADPVKPKGDPLRTPPKEQQTKGVYPNGWVPNPNNSYDMTTARILDQHPSLSLEQARGAAFRALHGNRGW